MRRNERAGNSWIGADLPLDANRFQVRELIEAFKIARQKRPDLRLRLAGRRDPDADFSVMNFVEEQGLASAVEFYPYFKTCAEFPFKKEDADLWIDRQTFEKDGAPSAEDLLRGVARPGGTRNKIALFVTSFHPLKFEGNSALMTQYISYLKSAGYTVHVLYYAIDRNTITDATNLRSHVEYDLYVEVPVTSKLVGKNKNGLNVHVDDWCGIELINATADLTAKYDYDIAIVNYPFASAVFDVIPSYAKKILLTHDSFANRNQRLLAQGYPESSWVSIDPQGERMACLRSDVVVALQDGEAQEFRDLTDGQSEVVVIGPIPSVLAVAHPAPGPKLRIGYMGSGNYVNEHNLIAFLEAWGKRPALQEKAELYLAGGASVSLPYYAPAKLMSATKPKLLGKLPDVSQLFEQCDVIINPERGGTGIKIKTLEALAHGSAVITTLAGSNGIGSASRFHCAKDMTELAAIAEEIALDQNLIDVVRNDSVQAYDNYLDRNQTAMEDLLGPVETMVRMRHSQLPTLVTPAYVKKHAAHYHTYEFKKFFERIDVRGKRVLEIGSDYHLATARLFAANGAESVTATNLGNWRSEEPLPENVKFVVGDLDVIIPPEGGFDIVYGIAILEHVVDTNKMVHELRRLLRPGGVGYLQGYPMWTSATGHHAWIIEAHIAKAENRALATGVDPNGVVYSFSDEKLNPIPPWSHLNRSEADFQNVLKSRKLSDSHALAVSNYIYNSAGQYTGGCSNAKTPTAILNSFNSGFAVAAKRLMYSKPDGEHFQNALQKFDEVDLKTDGLEVWFSDDSKSLPFTDPEAPTISVVVPVYNVQDYLQECTDSVLRQNFSDLEVIIVDDKSTDGSLQLAEEIAKRDSRVRIVRHEKNQGLGPARNTGVQHARGKYILFLDSDDKLASKDALRAMLAPAELGQFKVVVGSCEQIRTNGTLGEFDRWHDRERDGRPGGTLTGMQAFEGALGIPESNYIPMRAWGTLIEREFYTKLAMDFPGGEHEDMAHTPFLYLNAGDVYYEPTIIVQYRQREGSLSKTSWSAAKVKRYENLWSETRKRVLSYGLNKHLGNAAALHAWHLIWKVESHTLDESGYSEFFPLLERILEDAITASNDQMLFRLIDAIRDAKAVSGKGMRSFLLGHFKTDTMVKYHASKVCTTGQFERDFGNWKATQSGNFEYQKNEARVTSIFADYDTKAPENVKNFPAMLTYGDRSIYFHAGRTYQSRGSIIDGGCFVGGTTTALVEGLRHNPDFVNKWDGKPVIKVYDLFRTDEEYIIWHLKQNFPGIEVKPNESFQPVFDRNMKPYAQYLDVRAGDVTAIGYKDAQPIEIFGVDFCKGTWITDYAVREFFPRLLVGATVIQQDFIHEYHPHIHLSMMRLKDYFERDIELKWGGSVSFRCVKPIDADVVRKHFGTDQSWYKEVETNTQLMKELIASSLYDENKWSLMLTLALYLLSMDKKAEALAVYRDARRTYPQFESNELTHKMLEGAEV